MKSQFIFKIRTSIFVSFLTIFNLIAFPSEAQTQSLNKPSESASGFNLKAETTLPVFLGIGLGYSSQLPFEFAIYYGFTPSLYYNLIGDVAASTGGNSSYDDVIDAAFQNNSALKFQAQYFLDTKNKGWSVAIGYYQVSSSGKAEIDTVLAATTGNDYTTLKNLLIALGRSTEVDMSGVLSVLEIKAAYSMELNPKSIIRFFGGLAKVMTADVQIKTGLTNFENTQAGNSLMRQSEDDLEKIIIDNGLSPTIGAEYSWSF